MEYVTPNAIVTPAQVRQRVKRAAGQSEDLVVSCVNVTTAMLESLTRRQLRERVYVVPFSLTGTIGGANLDEFTCSSAPDAGKLRVDMDVLHPGDSSFPAGCRVAGVAGLVATLTRRSLAGGAATLRFGSEPLWVDGDATREILLPECPVLDGVAGVYSIQTRSRYSDVLEVQDLTALDVDVEAGILIAPYAQLYRGTRNVAIECRAGYRPASGAATGSEEWAELSEISMGIAEVLFRDAIEILGRATESTLGGDKKVLVDVELPKRLLGKIARFEREVAP